VRRLEVHPDDGARTHSDLIPQGVGQTSGRILLRAAFDPLLTLNATFQT
jgi:hypothetical protein